MPDCHESRPCCPTASLGRPLPDAVGGSRPDAVIRIIATATSASRDQQPFTRANEALGRRRERLAPDAPLRGIPRFNRNAINSAYESRFRCRHLSLDCEGALEPRVEVFWFLLDEHPIHHKSIQRWDCSPIRAATASNRIPCLARMDPWCAIAAYAARLPVSPSRGPRSRIKIADSVEYVKKERKVRGKSRRFHHP